MLKKTSQGYYVLEKLASQKGVIHGFSTRKFGDCNPLRSPEKTWPNAEKFLNLLGIKKENFVLADQVHGNKIKVVNQEHSGGKIVKSVDGLITQTPGLALGIHTADCLPLMYYDPVLKAVGVAHAGWRGVIKEISRKMIQVLIRLGSLPEDIIVGIGPYIGPCCYWVEEKRIARFKNVFGPLKGMVKSKQGKNYLDLGVPTRFQLTVMGVPAKNIEFSKACTACQNIDFFSKRKDKPEDYGGILEVIALKA